jgi:hypothetical protein
MKHPVQGRQIFLDTTYQNGEKYTKRPQNIPNGHKVYQISIKYYKCPIHITNGHNPHFPFQGPIFRVARWYIFMPKIII